MKYLSVYTIFLLFSPAYGQEEPWSHRSDYISANSPYMGYQGYRNPYGWS